ncbi:MAG TPA: HigA family addiction module antitoxin [Caulobacteraceae bacterium]
MAIRDYSDFASPLPHPGEHLREDYLPAYRLTAGALAKAMGLKDRARVERLVREQQPVTADTALRLGKVFGTSADLWLNMQAQHDRPRPRSKPRISWRRSSGWRPRRRRSGMQSQLQGEASSAGGWVSCPRILLK